MLEVVLGAVIAIVLTITVETWRKPKLALSIAVPVDMEYQDRPAKNARFLLIECKNRPLPWFARWMSRSAALQCHGTVSFHHLDGQNVFGRSMPIRWSGSPEPAPSQIILGDQRGFLIDPQKITVESRVDIYPGEKARLDVAVKLDDESECYGWSNLSYFSSPIWRNPDWKLNSGRYLVKVTVTSAGEQCSDVFRLINDVQRRDCRIEKAMPTDRVFGDV